LVFKLHFSYLLNRHLRGCLHDGMWDDFDVLKYVHRLNESPNADDLNTSKSSRLISHPGKAGS
jgi:hypothetical protein